MVAALNAGVNGALGYFVAAVDSRVDFTSVSVTFRFEIST